MHSHFNDKCITVFSASSYDPEMNNSSGILKLFQNDDIIQFISFPPIPRLEKIDASYYKVQAFNENNEKSRVCFSMLHPKLNPKEAVRMVTTVNNRKIKGHQSLRFNNPLFRRSSKPVNNLIQKPCMLHSESLYNFNENGIKKDDKKSITRSNFSFDDLNNLS